jgi:hypothetical protein
MRLRALFNQVLGMTLKENFLALMIEQKVLYRNHLTDL